MTTVITDAGKILGSKGITTDANGYVYVQGLPLTATLNLTFTAKGYVTKAATVTVADLHAANDAGRHNFFELAPAVKPIPPVLLTADDSYRLHVCTTAQGLLVGTLPAWEGAISWVSPDVRRKWFDAKHASPVCGPGGDTHALVNWSDNVQSVYNEPGQPYQTVLTQDWTKNPNGFLQLVHETMWDGFVPVVTLQGDFGASTALRQWAQVNALLKADPDYGDLRQYVTFFFCWDSCFYGTWSPADFKKVGEQVYVDCPTCLPTIEMQTGHIPTGGGAADWLPGGTMAHWRAIFVEFNDGDEHSDSTWQVLGRLLPYRRPADQPAGDDPSPPHYLTRGQVAVCWEYRMYEWVRVNVADDSAVRAMQASIAKTRSYLNGVGCGHAN